MWLDYNMSCALGHFHTITTSREVQSLGSCVSLIHYLHRACCVVLPCCLYDLACFFLPSFCNYYNIILVFTHANI